MTETETVTATVTAMVTESEGDGDSLIFAECPIDLPTLSLVQLLRTLQTEVLVLRKERSHLAWA